MADPRLDAYANWLVQNQDKQGTPEFETVATAYKGLRGNGQAAPAAQADPYAGKSTDDILKSYHAARMAGADDKTLARIADAYVSAEHNNASTIGKIGLAADEVARQLANGVPIIGGALDEGSAYLNTLGGGDYQENLDYQRARDRWAQRAAPVTTAALNVAGGVASGVAAAPLLGAGAGSSSVPLALKVAGGAAAGVPIGAADAFLRAEGDQRGTAAAIGGATGGLLGAAVPLAGAGFSAGARRVFDYLSSDQAIRKLGISRQAADILIRQLQTDLTPQGAGRIAAAGPDAMVADAGPAASNLLDTALQRSGPSSTAARDAIESRVTNANQQLRGTLDQTLGAPVGVETRQAGIRQSTAGARQQAYDAAYDQPIDFNTPAGQQLAADIRRLQEYAPWAIDEAKTEIGLRGEKPTLVRILDRATRALNTAAFRDVRGGALRGNTPIGDASGGLSNDIRASLREAVPEYATALDTAADPISRVQATEFGATILNPNVTREQVAQQLAGMGGGERRAVMQGLRDQIDEVMANVKQVASDPNSDAGQLRETLKKVSSQAARAKIEAVLGQNASRAFYGQVGRFARAMELRASVTTNSRTFGRQSVDQQVKQQLEPGILGSLLEGSPVQAGKKIIQRLTGVSPERRLQLQDQIYGEIARALTTVRGQDAQRYLTVLRRALETQAPNTAGSTAVGRLGQAATAGAVPATVNQVLPRGP